ncbi:MAG: DUF3592 domain-containing protein [Anaerolineae bacterium]
MEAVLGPTTGACIVGGGAGIFLLVGLFLTWSALRDFMRERASKHWPLIEGEVISATLRETTSTTSERVTTFYLPQVEYAYSVGGQRYTSRQITFGGQRALPSPEEADVVIHKYPAGGRVQVYYDPTHPATAVLEPSQVGNVLLLLLAGVIFFGCGIFLSLFAYALTTKPQ